MERLKSLMNNFEKLTKIDFLLIFIAISLFLDCYALLRFDNGLIQLLELIEGSIDGVELLIFAFSIFLTFSLIIPILVIPYDFVYGLIKQNDEINKSNFVKADMLERIGIIENNYAAYIAGKKETKSSNNCDSQRALCQSIILLSILEWALSSESNPSLLNTFIEWPDFSLFKTILWIAVFLLAILILRIGFGKKPEHIGYVYLPNHGFHIESNQLKRSTPLTEKEKIRLKEILSALDDQWKKD